MANKGTFDIVDSLDYEISNVDNLKTQYSGLKDSADGQCLEIEVDVTHGGYVNKNFFYYMPDGQAKGAASFFQPYPKPVLADHISSGVPVGRTFAAAYIPLLVDSKDKNNPKVPKSKIRVKSLITDQKAIEYVLDRRFLTVSSGGKAVEPPTCSICGAPLESMGSFGMVMTCEHQKGKTYKSEDGNDSLCFLKIGEVDYSEYSFVNMPADHTPTHVASVVSARFVPAGSTPASDSVSVDNSTIMDSVESTTITDKKTDTGGNSMPENTYSDLDLLAIFTLNSTAECKDCNLDEWKDEKEIKEAEAFDSDFCKAMDSIFGVTDKDLPPTGSKERMAMKTTFCGPNHTFPIPDCRHVSVGMAMLNWPKVKAKYSDSVRSKIASCINGRAKTLGCNTESKKDSETLAQVKTLTDEVTQLKTTIQEREAEVKTANDQISELNVQIKKKMAEKVVDMSIMAKRASVKDLLSETDSTKRNEVYGQIVEDYAKRTNESLTDSIADLGLELKFNIEDSTKVDDPQKKTQETPKPDSKKETKPKTGAGAKLFS